ncbi:MAG: hypothetical protein V3T82_04295 [Nitrospinaceae bacterium]
MKKMTFKRFQALVEAYGSQPSRWPAAERKNAEAFLAENLKARAIVGEARSLDAALNGLPSPKIADKAFIQRLGTVPFAARAAAIGAEPMPASFQEFLRGLFPGKSLVPQGIGLAMAGALGIWLGFAADFQRDSTVVEVDASQYFLDNPALDEDLERFQ